MKRLFFLIICIFSLSICIAQTHDYPIIEKDGNKYYEYTIQPGDGLFAIARKFGIKQNDLHEANINLTTNIKVGDKLLIPIHKTIATSETKATTTHIVEAKQTLYSISRLYNVPIDTLIALNPDAKNGIKVGETIIISKKEQITTNKEAAAAPSQQKVSTTTTTDLTHIVQKKETLFSISKKYNVAIHDLIALNPELNDGLKAGSVIIIKKGNSQDSNNNVPNIEEKKLNQPIEIKQTTEPNKPTKEHKTHVTPQPADDTIPTITPLVIDPVVSTTPNNNSKLNIAYLLPLVPENSNEEKNLQRFIEFYRGSLLALNNAKNQGISANVYTYNLPKSTSKIDEVILQLKEQKIDIVIGPAYSEQLNQVLTYTKENNITTIVPFSSKIDSTYYHPNLLQFNPPQDYLFSTVLTASFAHRNLQYIIAHFDNCTNKGEIFANNLKSLLVENGKEFKEITLKPEYVDSLTQMVGTDTTILVLSSSKINDVAPIIDSLNRYQLPQLQVWGFEDWGTNIIKKYPQTLYYSLFYAQETNEYKQNYKAWFGARKQTVGAQYDLLGYDLTTYALNGIINGKPQSTSPSIYMQSYPTFEFTEGRWLNTKYYLLRWDNISIKEVKQ